MSDEKKVNSLHPVDRVPADAEIMPSGNESHVPFIREYGFAFQNVIMNRRDLGRDP